MIDAFTSANINYLAKARVLANSLKEYEPEVRMHLMLSDKIPDWLDVDQEPFDSIITIDDLGLDEKWVFHHSVVELCTAVKPYCFRYLIDKYNSEKLFYFDPDVVIFSKVTALTEMLDQHSILLTPHVSKEDDDLQAIIDNETSSMRHGIYNLGFLGLKNDPDGNRLVDWWSNRLKHFCHDNIPFGVFTDQRWMDFVPAFFDTLRVVREPVYNVATWNYSTRNITGSIESGIEVDGTPICFHHFSGVDNGASVMMLEKYASDMPTAWDLDKWYKETCDHQGQQTVSKHPWFYGFYDNGEKIDQKDRILFRADPGLQEEFDHPFSASKHGNSHPISFYQWVKNHRSESVVPADIHLKPFKDWLSESKHSFLWYVDKTTKLPQILKKVIHKSISGLEWLIRKVL